MEQDSLSPDTRDFPRLSVEAKVRIATAVSPAEAADHPAAISDLSLGGARLTTPALLNEGDTFGVVPFSGLVEGHPLHRVLEFQVMWGKPSENSNWREYGLAHKGSILDVLNSWLGHLLFRKKEDTQLSEERREHRRLRLDKATAQKVTAFFSHDKQPCELTLLDIAPGGFLASALNQNIPLGVHLEMRADACDPPLRDRALTGCVVESLDGSDTTFYRVAFDPDSLLDDASLTQWADNVGGELVDY